MIWNVYYNSSSNSIYFFYCRDAIKDNSRGDNFYVKFENTYGVSYYIQGILNVGESIVETTRIEKTDDLVKEIKARLDDHSSPTPIITGILNDYHQKNKYEMLKYIFTRY